MSSQEDLNLHPTEFVLYYVNFINEDPTVYLLDCSEICSLSYDMSDDLVISDWKLDPPIAAPSTGTLLTYELEDVLTFYNNFYITPTLISQFQPWRITADDLINVRTDSSMEGFVVMDITNNQQRIWDGSSWLPFGPQLYLKVDGTSEMKGDLNAGGNDLVNIGTVHQSSPSAVSLWSSATAGIAFTAATPQVIAVSGFTVDANPGSDFSANTSTGQLTYNGSATRWFRVTIDYSYTSLAPGSTQQLRFYISKNGSTTIGKRKEVSFISGGQTSVWSDSISDVIQLANTNTIQLGGEYSASATVNVSNVSYSIVQV